MSKKNEKYNLDKIVKSPFFQKHLKTKLDAYDFERNAFYLKPGLKLKRHPYDNLEDKGILNVSSFSNEFLNISEKKSSLPKAERDFILLTCIPVCEKVVRELIVEDHMKEIQRCNKKIATIVDKTSDAYIAQTNKIQELQSQIEKIQNPEKKQ